MQKPIIGITPSISREGDRFFLYPAYSESILAAGGVPLLLMPTEDEGVLHHYLSLCDGFLLSGGADIHPSLYGEEAGETCGPFSPARDAFESTLVPLLLKSGKPILAICRGMQMLNVVLGGTLYQDIDTECALRALHRMPSPSDKTCHSITPLPDTPLSALCGGAPFAVNSYHHQAINALAPALAADAYSEDGLVEAVHLPSAPFVLGVQWHPERLALADENARALFAAFLDAARPSYERKSYEEI